MKSLMSLSAIFAFLGTAAPAAAMGKGEGAWPCREFKAGKGRTKPKN